MGESLSAYINNSYIKTLGFTDHRLVCTSFVFSSFKHGKGLYKLNTSLFSDSDYCGLMINVIHETASEYQELNPHLRWEMIKTNVKEVSQQYSRFKAREKVDFMRDLKDKLHYFEQLVVINPGDEEIWRNIAKIKSEIEILESERTRGAQIRSGLKYIEEGER